MMPLLRMEEEISMVQLDKKQTSNQGQNSKGTLLGQPTHKQSHTNTQAHNPPQFAENGATAPDRDRRRQSANREKACSRASDRAASFPGIPSWARTYLAFR